MGFLKAQVEKANCIGCGQCMAVCPVEAICMVEQKAEISDACVECGACTAVCPVGAISL